MEGSYRNGSGGVNGSSSMTRAERFEDEKRRIVDSLFNKKDDDGSLLESYITHVRIKEDASYPSSAPPPNSNPNAKKDRLVIVAVRKSGRVRMHKARENVNGSFSIGKTWQLDDVSAVQSFNGAIPRNAAEEEQKAWAGGVGFIVTIGKPYYWQANTQKEKHFFIASLVKIYTKYTGGKTPDLIGFDAREMDQLQGVGGGRAAPSSQASSPLGPVSSPTPGYGQSQNRPPPKRNPSREPSREPPPSRDTMQHQMSFAGAAPSISSQTSTAPLLSRNGESPSGSFDSDRMTSTQANQASLRRSAGNISSQDSFAKGEDSGSIPPRPRAGMSGNAPGRFQDRSGTPASQRAGTPDSNFSGVRDATNDTPPVPAPLTYPPERRRPPMPTIGDPRHRNQNSSDNIVPAPLASTGMRRDDIGLPTRFTERSQPREINTEMGSTNGNGTIPAESLAIQESPASTTTQSSTLSPAVQIPRSTVTSPVSPETPIDEDVRPGLGPMIKKKRSRADVANTFLKAANAANSFNTFKPRAGGAAERLREQAARQAERSPDTPDGITGVIPAPSLLRATSADTTTISSLSDSLPEVKITFPSSDTPSSVQDLPKQSQELIPSKSKVKEVKRPKPASEIMQKELASLGIDPSILAGRGNELVAAWDEFGWVGEGVHTKNIDQMKFRSVADCV